MSETEKVLDVEDLAVSYRRGSRAVRAIRHVAMHVREGEAVGLVGESGSGKSTLGRAVLGMLPKGVGRIERGRITLCGKDATHYTLRQWQQARGQAVAIVFQDPLSFLNPVMRIGKQIGEGVALHDPEARLSTRVGELLELVKLPRGVAHSYPHELSGGMRQRVLLAIALGCRPSLLVADEPTTALDVTTQAEVLTVIREIQQQLKMGLLLISHDLGVVSNVCSRLYVMYAGTTVEWGRSEDVFKRPSHPYTAALLRSAAVSRTRDRKFFTIEGDVPNLAEELPGCAFAPRCTHVMDACRAEFPAPREIGGSGHLSRCLLVGAPQPVRSPAAVAPGGADEMAEAAPADAPPIVVVERVNKTFRRPGGGSVVAAKDVSFSIQPGEVLALIGESGSGKSTLGRIILGLLQPDSGKVTFKGRAIADVPADEWRTFRTAMQPIFQDPGASFNPRRTVANLLAQAQPSRSREEADRRSIDLLEDVGLHPGEEFLHRYPHELSGGQRQRLGIASALAMDPVLVIADEPLSGADVSIRGQILNLLVTLQQTHRLAYLMITHDISIARAFAHRVVVLKNGEVVEAGLAEEVIDNPQHPYTRKLIAAVQTVTQAATPPPEAVAAPLGPEQRRAAAMERLR